MMTRVRALVLCLLTVAPLAVADGLTQAGNEPQSLVETTIPGQALPKTDSTGEPQPQEKPSSEAMRPAPERSQVHVAKWVGTLGAVILLMRTIRRR